MKKFLVVDDDSLIYKIMKMITPDGVTIDYSCDPIDALDKIRNNRYDAILTDFHMPKLDGVNLVRIVQEERLSNAPIYIFTNYDLDVIEPLIHEARCMPDGIFDKQDLKETLKSIKEISEAIIA